MSTKLFFLGLISVFLFLGFACAGTSKDLKPEEDAELLSEEDEIKFGYYVDAIVCHEFPVLKNKKLTGQVSAIGEKLAKNSLRPDLKFTFKVLNTETVNAFSGPGGFVYVTVGLLDRLKSKDELAAVLSHEIGHCCARHSIKSWRTAQKITSVLTVVDLAALVAGFPPVATAGGDIIADVGQRAAYLASIIVYQGYSRGYEYQADELGITQMEASGYNPQSMIIVFEKFVKLRKEEGQDKGLIILSSHPHLEDRIQHAREFIERLNLDLE